LQAGREVNPLRQLVAIPLLRRQVRVVETGSDCGNNSRVSPNVQLGDARHQVLLQTLVWHIETKGYSIPSMDSIS
jgi:hypothetical protein